MNAGESIISVRLKPGSAVSEAVAYAGGVFHIKVAAPPVQGRANTELINFLSHSLGLPKSSVNIARGERSRHKRVSVTGLSIEQIIRRLFPSGGGAEATTPEP